MLRRIVRPLVLRQQEHAVMSRRLVGVQQLSLPPKRVCLSTISTRRSVITGRLYHLHSAKQFSSNAAAAATTTTTTTTTTTATANKDEPHFFWDNIGKFFLATIGAVIVWLVRSSYAGSNRMKLRDELEEASALDPLEMDDLRVANSSTLTPAAFSYISRKCFETFPNPDRVNYKDFVSLVIASMKQQYLENNNINNADGEAAAAVTLELGHLLDRVVVRIMEEQSQNELPLDLLLTGLSLGLDSEISERVKVLYKILSAREGQQNDKITQERVIDMVSYLQQTCQLVPEAQIVEKEGTRFPIPQYRRGTAAELVTAAWKEKVMESYKPKGSANDKDVAPPKEYDLETFEALLTRARCVCAWGECYYRKRK